jgi:hypothetical protein
MNTLNSGLLKLPVWPPDNLERVVPRGVTPHNVCSTSVYSTFSKSPLQLVTAILNYGWATYLIQTDMQNELDLKMMLPISCRPSRRLILGSWPDSGGSPGRDWLIAGRTFRAGLDNELFPVAFCGTQLTKKGLRQGEGEFL